MHLVKKSIDRHGRVRFVSLAALAIPTKVICKSIDLSAIDSKGPFPKITMLNRINHKNCKGLYRNKSSSVLNLVVNCFTGLYCTHILKLQVGDKKMLAASAAYPRQFGLAVAGLLPKRKERPRDEPLSLESPFEGSDLGALDDFLRGSKVAWWRKLL